MDSTLLLLLVLLAGANLAVLLYIVFRSSAGISASVRRAVDEDLRRGREEGASSARLLREENAAAAQALRTEVTTTIQTLGDSLSAKVEAMRTTLDQRVRELQDRNDKKLEEMRRTVDEKLQGTLEKRLGESFRLVSERLEAVHRGLGDMQKLATGVGDLQRMMTNVKARGTWAEVQLGTILEQFLAPGQYERNVSTKRDSRDVVEFAIRLPGRNGDPTSAVWLPIDSKFPQEDYLRLHDAADRADPDAESKAAEALERTLRTEATKIREKYVDPPATTDFAIMFLATEGLYAEAIRRPALVHDLQRDRVILAGPTTLAALLNALRMGFQTLAIQERAAEVWEVLGAVKTEFGKFGDVLDRVKKQLKTAERTIDQAQVRTRAMGRTLRSVEELPATQARELLSLGEGGFDDEEEGSGTDAETDGESDETP